MYFQVINSDICNWTAHVSYLIQPNKAQKILNPPITDVRIKYLKLYYAIELGII